ncbi:hypothetical protein K3G39_11355 [Pontibacter sp. HSC-14F20]|uniref:hypothetical protein n=1 Tax=Pontibacter sp. HSC-14F20 TaxID=2864136 RepID=UPI001C72F2CD|nr:hypothetical protein [Pontibacter sp. HSC-14F20]MBX0333833.1 hypothetical protein [Pontibacter sp. HSC-14F20]
MMVSLGYTSEEIADSTGRKQLIPNKGTIGIRVDSDLQIEEDAITRELVPTDIRNLNDYIAAL